jgi:hypothetical protein
LAVTDVCILLLQESGPLNLRSWIETGQALALVEQRGYVAEGILIRTEQQRIAAAKRLVERPPRLAVVVVEQGQSPPALGLLNELQDLSPRCCLAIAGVEGTLESPHYTSHIVPSVILLGEWVETTADLIQALRTHRDSEPLPGTWWRTKQGWITSPRRVYMPRLGEWPAPRLGGLHATDVSRLLGDSLPILASRGYPFSGLFSSQPRIRDLQETETFHHLRPAARIVDEALDLANRHKLRRILFEDDIFPWDVEWTETFAALWSSEVRLPFTIRTISEHLLDTRLQTLRAAGLERVELCLESGNEALRNRLSDVNTENAQIREALELCKALGLRTHIRLMVGVPGETLRTIESTVAFAKACGATTVEAEIHRPLPTSPQWDQVELELTGAGNSRMAVRPSPEILRDAGLAVAEIRKINALAAALRTKRKTDVALDGLADLPSAKVRAPLEGSFRVGRFHAGGDSELALAIRVPAQLTWSVKLPRHPELHFGMLLEPALPGERCRLPISFALRISQGGQTWRLFQKILVQALDPDSRLWHWFRLPIINTKPGWAEVTFENLVYGHDASYIPPGRDIWAGWSRIVISDHGSALNFDEATDHDYDAPGEHGALGSMELE